MKRLGAVLCLLAAATATAGARDGPAASVLVTTTPPRSGTMADVIEAYGAAGPANDTTQTLSLPQEGRVRRILRMPGEAVEKGAPILEWEVAGTVRQGWEQARTALVLAQRQQAHAALLLAHHLGTRDQLDQAQKALGDAQAAVDELRREGADRSAQTLMAPFNGIVVTVPVAQGDRVPANTALATLARRDGIVATVGLEPAHLARVHPGQAATVQPLSGGDAMAATVLRVDAALNPRTRLVDVDLRVPDTTMLPGLDVRAEILVGQLSGWLVPHAAVLQDSSGTFLFQSDSGRARRVSVSVLGMSGGTDIVAGDVVASRPVVVEGAAQLDDGAPLRTDPAR